MKKNVLFLLLLFSVFNIWATDVPKLLILTTSSDEVQIPIASIQKITYDEAGTTMYVATNSGLKTYAVTDIVKMTLANVPEATALNQLTDSPTPQLTKFEKDGAIYIVQDGKIYTMKGEQK